MNPIYKRLTYANVMSSIAVFLVLGGATAFAASQLGKNSVGAKQLKKNSVTAAKIKKNAVTGAKIKNDAVTGAKVKDGSLSGSDINLGSLGAVPNATKSSLSAKTEQIAQIFSTANVGAPKQTILNFNGLVLTNTCGPAENFIEATTTVAHSVIGAVTAQDNDNEANIDFNPGETFEADLGHSEGDLEMYILEYTRPDGVNVSVTLHDVDAENGGAFPGTPQAAQCLVAGIAVGS